MSRKVLILDSSQLQAYGECPQMWHLSNEESLTLSNDIRDDFAMGTYGHKLLEIYYTELSRSTLQNAITAINNYQLPEGYPLSHERREAVFNRVRDYWIKYSTVGDILISTCPIPGIEMYEGWPMTVTKAEPLVEKGFSFPLLDTSEYLFVLEGKIDLIGWISGTEVFMDHKFQSLSRFLYPKSIQFRDYALATGIKTGIINYVRLHKELTKDTMERKIISFAPGELTDWRVELIDTFVKIEKEISKGSFYKNRAACNGRYGRPCQFTRICDERELVTIQAIKETMYKKKDEWKPW